MLLSIKTISEHLKKMEKDAKDECHAYAMKYLKSQNQGDKYRTLIFQVKVDTIKRIREFIRKGK